MLLKDPVIGPLRIQSSENIVTSNGLITSASEPSNIVIPGTKKTILQRKTLQTMEQRIYLHQLLAIEMMMMTWILYIRLK